MYVFYFAFFPPPLCIYPHLMLSYNCMGSDVSDLRRMIRNHRSLNSASKQLTAERESLAYVQSCIFRHDKSQVGYQPSQPLRKHNFSHQTTQWIQIFMYVIIFLFRPHSIVRERERPFVCASSPLFALFVAIQWYDMIWYDIICLLFSVLSLFLFAKKSHQTEAYVFERVRITCVCSHSDFSLVSL